MENAYYDTNLDCIKVKFAGQPTLAEFKAIAIPMIDLLKKHGTQKIINDTSELEINAIENQEWAQNEWFPKAHQAGLQYFAFVVSSNIFGEVSAKQTNEKAEEEGNIAIQYFETTEEAESWIQNC